jgi:Na+-transporting NADH:ubiquinone oxidoreductase subunit NqrC
MNATSSSFLLIISIAFSILISSYVTHLAMGQSENSTQDNKNNTGTIINLTENTVTVVDKTTNETNSVTPYEGGNATTNNTTNAGSSPVYKENTTTNTSLTEKLEDLRN